MNAEVKAFLDKYWWVILIVVVVVIICIVLYFTIYKSGKQAGTASVLATISNPTVDAPYTTDESIAIRQYATQIEADFNVGFFGAHNSDLWDTLANSTTDRVLLGTSMQYQLDKGSTLITDIGNIIQNGWTAWNPLVINNASTVVTRLKALLGQ